MSSLFLWFYCLELPKALFLTAAVTMFFLLLRQRFGTGAVWKLGIVMLLFLWSGSVIWETILSRTPVPGGSEIQPLFHSYLQVLRGENREILRSNLMNVLLFYPAGLLVAALLPEKWRPAVTLLLIFFLFGGFSTGIEVCQHQFGLGEVEADDVLHNTLGAVSGALIVTIYDRFVSSGQKKRAP